MARGRRHGEKDPFEEKWEKDPFAEKGVEGVVKELKAQELKASM